MPVAENGQRTFPGAGTKPGVEIWRIEVDSCKSVVTSGRSANSFDLKLVICDFYRA